MVGTLIEVKNDLGECGYWQEGRPASASGIEGRHNSLVSVSTLKPSVVRQSIRGTATVPKLPHLRHASLQVAFVEGLRRVLLGARRAGHDGARAREPAPRGLPQQKWPLHTLPSPRFNPPVPRSVAWRRRNWSRKLVRRRPAARPHAYVYVPFLAAPDADGGPWCPTRHLSPQCPPVPSMRRPRCDPNAPRCSEHAFRRTGSFRSIGVT